MALWESEERKLVRAALEEDAMKECLINIALGNAVRGVMDAVNLKVPQGNLGFSCPECHKPVKPFIDGMQGPHFEHMDRNPKYSLSDV